MFQDDGLGAETVGAYGGELIYPDTFRWSFSDGMLYIDWLVSDEYLAEYGKKLDVFVVEKEEGAFWVTDYLDYKGTSRRRFVVTDRLDITDLKRTRNSADSTVTQRTEKRNSGENRSSPVFFAVFDIEA